LTIKTNFELFETSMNFTHKCQCGVEYTDNDPDPYFCPECVEKRKAIARSVDAKIASNPKTRPMSALQEYDAAPKVRGFMHVSLN